MHSVSRPAGVASESEVALASYSPYCGVSDGQDRTRRGLRRSAVSGGAQAFEHITQCRVERRQQAACGTATWS